MTRLEQLLAEQAAIEADGGTAGPELQGRIGWHERKAPSARGDFEVGVFLSEQTEDWQEYLAGYESEARRELGRE